MSAQAGLMFHCENLQAELTQFFNTCPDISEPLPLYEYLLSPVNRGNLQTVVSPGDGKVRNISLLYTPRLLTTEVDADVANPTCVATDERGNRWQYYTIDTTNNLSVNEKITLNELNEVCQPTSMIFAEKINRLMDGLDRAMAYKLTEEAVLQAGNWGTTVQNVTNDFLQLPTLRVGSSDAPAFNTMQKLRTATKKSGYCAPYFVAAGEDLTNYAEAIKLGCCTDYGIDLAAMMNTFGSAVAYDQAVVDAMGGDEFGLVLMNGAMQVVTWNLYGGSNWNFFNQGSEIIGRGTTRRGLPFDMTVKYDCGVWHIILIATAEVKSMPLDMFQAGDIYEGVNFINKLEVANT
jgi:hypothetical protein